MPKWDQQKAARVGPRQTCGALTIIIPQGIKFLVVVNQLQVIVVLIGAIELDIELFSCKRAGFSSLARGHRQRQVFILGFTSKKYGASLMWTVNPNTKIIYH
jgi:hypothetical protein